MVKTETFAHYFSDRVIFSTLTVGLLVEYYRLGIFTCHGSNAPALSRIAVCIFNALMALSVRKMKSRQLSSVSIIIFQLTWNFDDVSSGYVI